MRVFAAAELPPTLIEALAETSALLRTSVRGRYVASDSFHVTLAFLGEIPVSRVDVAIDALEAGCRGHKCFTVSLGALGYFGRRSAATLWQGFSEEGGFSDLAKAVRAELLQAGFAFDDKKFKPHVTLMRKADLKGGKLLSPALATGDVSSVVLFKSDLSGERPLYEPLHIVKLPLA